MQLCRRVIVSVAAAVVMASAGHADQVVALRVKESSTPATAVFLGARPVPLPQVAALPAGLSQLRPMVTSSTPVIGPAAAVRPGNAGGPVRTAIQLIPLPPESPATAATPRAVGTYGSPFATSRVDLNRPTASPVNIYPYRAAGKLALKYHGRNGWCSAALIDKGLLLTAAHCVADFGKGYIEDADWSFIPGYNAGKGAYGTYRARAAFALLSYLDGTDRCDGTAICENDVAVIVLRPDSRKRYPGELTGWLGVQMDGWGFAYASEADTQVPIGITQITQLGYPGGIDRGERMLRNDSQGLTVKGVLANNTLLGSPLDGGSSGGPWVNNLGATPVFNGVATPAFATANMVVGVTSWGIVDGGKAAFQGASPFRSSNIGALIKTACASYPSACSK